MSIKNIINQCIERNIKLSEQDDNLKVDAPKGAMTQDLLSAIKNNKKELLEFLGEYSSSSTKSQLRRVFPEVKEAFLSSGQNQMWLLDNAFQNNDNYQFYRILHIEGSINVQVLEKSLAEIVARHTILRTTYHEIDHGVIQRIGDGSDFSMKYLDLTEITHANKEEETRSAGRKFKQSIFDLSTDFMLQSLLLKTEPNCYQLHIKLHHISTDGWSIGLIVKELTDLYTVLVDGRDQQPIVPLQFIDYTMWQQGEASKQNVAKGLSFFEQYLADVPEIHSLPVTAGKRSEFSTVGHVERSFSDIAVRSLKSFCQKHHVTVFSFLQFSLSVVLARYSNSKDIVIGTPVANRSMEVLGEVVGYFVNTMPIRSLLQAEQSFIEALKAHHGRVLDLLEQQHVPFDAIVKQTMTTRTEGVSPLVQVMFALQNDEVPSLYLGEARIDVEIPKPDFMELDLDIDCIEENGVMSVSWGYAEDLFSATFVEGMADHFERLVASALDNFDTPIHLINMLSPAQADILKYDLNNTVMDYPNDSCIHTLFERQVVKTPENVAVQFEQQQLTYRQLNEKANQLAMYLKENHYIEPETLVGLCIERSIEMVIAILAILKAGGAYVPLAPTLPQARLKHLIEMTKMTVVMSDIISSQKLANIKVTAVQLDNPEVQVEWTNYPTADLDPKFIGVNERHLAYIIYTSGSTGAPKGVMIEHMACLNHCFGMISELSLDANCAVAQTAPISFDISVWQSITMLLVGGRTAIIKDEVVKSPVDLIEEVNSKNVTLLQIVPSLMSLVLDECENNGRDFSTLRCCSVTGEACPINLQQRWVRVFKGIPLVNAYGPAECADDVSLYTIGEIYNEDIATFTRLESQVRGYCRDYPSLFDKAVGSELFDSSGNRYLDLFCGAGALNYGHNNKILKSALVDYINHDGITHSLDLFTKAKANFLQTFERHILKPRDLDYKVMFTGPTGANTVEASLKLARKVSGRKMVVFCKNSFHGMTIGALSVTGYKDRAGIPLSHTEEIEFISQHDEYLDDRSFKDVIEALEEVPAAIILEIVQAEGGINVANKEWLQALAKYAKQKDILLIVDDIQAGCGRTGHFFSFEHYGIKPDLVCLSKSIGGYGLPMALLLIRPDLDIWKPAEHNGTFRGNNHAFVTGAKAIETYWSESDFEQQIQLKANYLKSGLQSLVNKYPQLNGKHKGLGLIQGIEFGSASLAAEIKRIAYKQYLVIETAGKSDAVLKFLPALTMTTNQLQECLATIDRIIASIVLPSSIRVSPVTMPVGKPLGNYRVYIVDEHNQLVPYGVIGELLVAGDGLARGYFNQPDMTASKFIELAIGDLKEKVYKTGDMVRYLPDGNMEFMGRSDDQVKIRGFRIELGEIQLQLGQLELVDSAMVVTKKLAGSEQLVGYVIPSKPLTEQMHAELVKTATAHLSAHLPEYMVPAFIIVLDKWPLTANGKKDIKALPMPEGGAFVGEHVAPQTQTEQVLVDIWSGLLDIGPESISTTANFFELGGHSLLAINTKSQLCQAGYDINISDLFQASTLKALAQKIKSSDAAGEGFIAPENLISSDATTITVADLNLIDLTNEHLQKLVSQVPGGIENISDIYSLSPLQEGMLFHHMVSSENDTYLSAFTLKLNSETLLNKLLDAFRLQVSRHDTLRTVFFWEGLSEPAQVVLKQCELVVDFVELGEYDSLEEAQNKMEGFREQRISLQQGPLLKLKVGKDSAKSDYFVLVEHHHLIMDHIGLDILVEELAAIVGQNQQRLIPSSPYRNIVAYSKVQNNDDKGVAYFKKKFVNFEEATVLFNPDTSRDGTEVTRALDASTSHKLRNLSKEKGYSVASVFHAAWALVSSVFSNSRDVAFGTVLSGRLNNYSSTQRTIGLAINSLPLRVAVKDLSVSQVLDQVAQNLQELIDVEQTPLSLVLKEISSNNSIFNSILNYRHSRKMLGENHVIEGLDILDATERTNYSITANVDDYGLQGDFNIGVRTSNGVDAQELQGYFVNAIVQLVNCLEYKPDTAFSSVSILSGSEVNQLLYTMNDTVVDYAKDKSIHALFEQQAQQNPDNVAVVFEDNQLTYKQLNEKANQLAHYLTAHHNIKTDSLVGLCVERSIDMVIGILAVLKAGGAYVPLDPSYPADRLSYMIKDAALTIVLSQTKVQNVLAGFGGTVVTLDGLIQTNSHFVEKYAKHNLTTVETGFISSNLAYVIYTSGSTGEPKGVAIEHRNTVAMLSWALEAYSQQELAVVLASTSLNFDLSVFELFLPLSAGTTIRVVDNVLDLASSKYVDDVTLVNTVPSAMDGLTKLNVLPANVKVINLAGEALRSSLVNDIFELNADVSVCNLYGPSEDTTYSTYARFDCVIEGTPSIGRVISNSIGLILDDKQQLVPYGVAGELYLGGDGLARSYLNRPDLTAERFIDNPYYDQSRANSSPRLYRTGDLVRYLSDGNLDYIGRVDFQVKIRGFRIELGEVESQLVKNDAVDSALVMAKEWAGSKQLVGYVKPVKSITDEKVRIFAADIKTALAEILPDYMVPGIIMVVKQWPLTPNGKIDRKELPQPDASIGQGDYVAPQTETEQVLVDIWTDLLNIEAGSIGTGTNFFEVGGHSILIPSMITRIDEAGYLLTVSDIYHASTLQVTASLMQRSNEQDSGYSLVSLVPENIEKLEPDMFDLVTLKNVDIENIVNNVSGGTQNVKDILPLTTLQERFLFQHLANPDNDPCWQYIFMKVKKANLEKLVDSINIVITRHDALRSVFMPLFPQQVSVVLKDYSLRVDYQTVNPQDTKSSALQQIEDLTHDMNLDKIPPIMLVVGKAEGDETCYVKLVAHHLMLDQVGASIVMDEVMAVLAGEAHLLTQPAPYRRVVAYISQHTDNEIAQQFFEQQLKGVNSATTVAGITQSSFSHQVLAQEDYLQYALGQKVRQIARQYNTSPAVFFHTAFAQLMSVVSNKNDVVFGSVFSGRQTAPPGSENAVGMFMNTLPFRVKMDAQTPHRLFESVKAALAGYLSHEHFSLNQAKQFTDLAMGESLFNGVLNFRRGKPDLADSDVFELLNDEDKMGSTSPLIIAISDDGSDFYINLKVDSRINIVAIWHLFKTMVVNLINGLANPEGNINVASDFESLSNTMFLIQNVDTDLGVAPINENSFITVELRKIWTEVFGLTPEQVVAGSSLWECEGLLKIDNFVKMLSQRFEVSLDCQRLMANHTFAQQVTFITNELMSSGPKEALIKDNIQKFGVI
ncbi:MAG: amino acid adenylation domain-containing protein [Colwellia sp.]|nr:amino acid adenylation domain-containing protein [Colwellia sp.]